MDIFLFCKNNLIIYSKVFSLQTMLFTRTSNERPSPKLWELKWNFLKRLNEGESLVKTVKES